VSTLNRAEKSGEKKIPVTGTGEDSVGISIAFVNSTKMAKTPVEQQVFEMMLVTIPRMLRVGPTSAAPVFESVIPAEGTVT
jgi:hypothetical protein